MTVYFAHDPLEDEIIIKHSPLILEAFNRLDVSLKPNVLFAVEGDINAFFCIQTCFEPFRVADNTYQKALLSVTDQANCQAIIDSSAHNQFAPLPPYQPTLFVFWDSKLETRVMFWDIKSHRDLYLHNPKVVLLGSLKAIIPEKSAYELQADAISLSVFDNLVYDNQAKLNSFREFMVMKNPKALVMLFSRSQCAKKTLSTTTKINPALVKAI